VESEGGIALGAWGQCRRSWLLRRRGGGAPERVADRSVAEWNEVKSRRVRRPWGRGKGRAFHGATHGLASGANRDGRVKSATLARPSFGWLRVQGREGALSAPGAGADLGAGSGAAEVAVGGGVALAAESARWPYGELCWPADWPQGAPAQRASGAPRSRPGRVSGASYYLRVALTFGCWPSRAKDVR